MRVCHCSVCDKNIHSKGVKALSPVSSRKHVKHVHTHIRTHTHTQTYIHTVACVTENRCARNNAASIIPPTSLSKLERDNYVVLIFLPCLSFSLFRFWHGLWQLSWSAYKIICAGTKCLIYAFPVGISKGCCGTAVTKY